MWYTFLTSICCTPASTSYEFRLNGEAESWVSLTTCFLSSSRQTIFSLKPDSYREFYEWDLCQIKWSILAFCYLTICISLIKEVRIRYIITILSPKVSRASSALYIKLAYCGLLSFYVSNTEKAIKYYKPKWTWDMIKGIIIYS